MWPRPSIAAERWLTVASRLGIRRDTLLAQRAQGWRTVSGLLRGALGIVGIVTTVLLCGVFDLLHVHGAIGYAGATVIVAAELLIAKRRVLGGGLEEALFTAGLLLIAFKLSYSASPNREFVVALSVSGALLLSAWRLLNPLLAALAVAALTVALAARLGSLDWDVAHGRHIVWVSLASYLLAGTALAAGARIWSRPSYDKACDYIVVILPLCGYAWPHVRFATATPAETIQALILPAFFAAVAISVGLLRRTHAPLIAGLVCIACVADGLHEISGWNRETRLIVGGLVLLVVCVCTNRWLLTPRRGITSNKIDDPDEALDVLQMASTAALPTPPPNAAAPAQIEGGGGKFSGGGASGDY